MLGAIVGDILGSSYEFTRRKNYDFEDMVRLAVSLGGDADTQATIAGEIAACVYPIPEHIAEECEKRLPSELLEIMSNFERFIKERKDSTIYGSEV